MTARERILVVDDDQATREATARLLVREGYEVLEASSGHEALQRVRDVHPSLVLMDMILPDLRGDEVLRRLKGDPELARVPVVLLSATENSPEQQAASLDAGSEDFISRPVSDGELAARVRAQLRQNELSEALRASEARFRDLIARQPDAVLVVDTDGLIRFANPAAAALFGRPESSLLGMELGAPFEDSGTREIEVQRSGGEPALAEVRIAPAQWEGSKAWITTLRDVTERRRAEMRLERLNRLYQVLSRTNEAIVRAADESTLFEAVCGIAVEHGKFLMAAVMGLDMTTGKLTPLAHVGAGTDYFAEVRLAVGDATPGTSARAAQAGRPEICNDLATDPRMAAWRDVASRRGFSSVASFPVRAGGAIFGSLTLYSGEVGYFRDDEVKLLEAVADDISFAMESMRTAAERRELEEQLRQAQRLEAIGQLTGGVAHDFNNLLTVILGNAEVLNERLAGDPRLAALASMVVTAAARGAELTQRLLAFARRQPLNPHPVAVDELAHNLEPLLRRTLGEHIHVSIRGDTSLWPALVDPAQLENALLNLSLNARDAMPAGGALAVEASNAPIDAAQAARDGRIRPGEYVMISVSDTGCGIAPENLSHIFEPFFTTKEKGKGTGLGLAMVYGFMKQSGGHIALDSEPGRGTAVRLYLPRAQGEATEKARDPGTIAHGGGESILLVEDDELVRRSAHGYLAALGYRVIAAASGAEALEVLHRGDKLDLLFTDVVMPGMGGRELADAARAARPGLKVLFTSGYAEDAVVHRGRLDPGVELLGKPYRRSELARRVRQVLDTPS